MWKNNIFIISGRVQSGKTTFAGALAETLGKEGFRIAGFLCRGTFINDRRDSYTLEELGSGIKIPMASSGFREGWFRYRRFYFNPAALEKGREMVLASLAGQPDLIVIDEVGPMEMEGRGWNSLLGELVSIGTIPQVWVVRDCLVDAVMEQWRIPAGNLVPADLRMEIKARERSLKHLRENIVNFKPGQ